MDLGDCGFHDFGFVFFRFLVFCHHPVDCLMEGAHGSAVRVPEGLHQAGSLRKPSLSLPLKTAFLRYSLHTGKFTCSMRATQ